ncbi:MAG: response regulator [Gammaproteobacteria bacterium]|nr:response regulator [Gammaproteobacteria bacterium]
MAGDKEALRQRLLVAFREEAGERMQLLADGLARLQQGEVSSELIEDLYREVHSLKGAARVVNIPGLGRVLQDWESLFAALRRGSVSWEPELYELAVAPLKLLSQSLKGAELEEIALIPLCQNLAAAARGAVFGPEPPDPGRPGLEGPGPEARPPPPAPVARSEAPLLGTVRVPTERLDSLLGLSEEALSVKLEAQSHADELRLALGEFAPLRAHRDGASQALRQLRGKGEALPPRLQEALRALMDYTSWSLDYLDQWHFRVNRLSRTGGHLAHGLSALTESLQDRLQGVLLMPCQSLAEGLPAMTQDIAAQTGKQALLSVSGAELQVDKRILDELKNPLEHLLRNAVAHGLETPEARLAAGKPAQGRIVLSFRHEQGDRFELVLEDDGAGFQAEALKAKAVAQGLMDAEQAEALEPAAVWQLAFASGLSTSPMLTELSGRGLGLSIVRDKLERLGGRLELDTEPGRGSRFRLDLPLAFATYRALLVRVADQLYALPAQAVQRALRVPASALLRAQNRPVLRWEDEHLPFWTLAQVLGIAAAPAEGDWLPVVLLDLGGQRLALGVDGILGDQEITVRPLGRLIKRLRNVMGAAVLGDGRIAPLLHGQDLLQSAQACEGEPISALPQPERPARRQRVLIAEDSFTSRGLLKSILESASYEVMTADDGLEAWRLLKQGDYDLLVSDVEMPHLNGFDLTEKLRADRELNELPVVLVTALQSAEDRARGLDAGADAYIVKSSFEQDNLLDVVRRLI